MVASAGACSAHLARPHVGVRADQRVLLGEALPAEVALVDVGVAALAAGDQVGHELRPSKGEIL